MPIPDPNALISNYPFGEADAVKKQIGGGVNAPYITNTCAIRMSRAFNKSGAKVPGNVPYMLTVKGGDGDRYALRVKEFRQWLEQKYGKPTLDERGTGTSSPPASFRGKPGIICFVDCGWSDASGHLDLWDGSKCVGHEYFSRAKHILLWSRAPAPTPSAPPASQGAQGGVVTASTLNVRSEPSPAGRVVGSLQRGARVPILGQRNGFYQVGPNIWAAASYIQVGGARGSTA